MKHTLPIALILVALAGCNSSSTDSTASDGPTVQTNLPEPFAFITPATTLQEVFERVGKCSRERGSGMKYYQYDMPNGSAVLLRAERPFDGKIIYAELYDDPSEIGLAP